MKKIPSWLKWIAGTVAVLLFFMSPVVFILYLLLVGIIWFVFRAINSDKKKSN
jgi:hypothetical protein